MYRTIETLIGYALGAIVVALVAPLMFVWFRAMLQVVGWI